MTAQTSSSIQAVILAAGYATRLYPLTQDKPKCLLSVGGQTILDSLCQKLIQVSEISDILIVTNAKFFDQLSHWKNNSHYPVPIKIINDGTTSNDNRLGAVGDLNFAIQKLKLGSDILLLASDNLFDQDLVEFIRFIKADSKVSIALYDLKDPKLAANKYGVIVRDSNACVVDIEEKPAEPKSSFIGMGLYYFPKDSLQLIQKYLASKNAKDAPGHYIHWLFNQGVALRSFLFGGMWYDIGDLQALDEANKIFLNKKQNPV